MNDSDTRELEIVSWNAKQHRTLARENREQRDRLIRAAYAHGASRADIHRATGLSFARIQQILDLTKDGA